MSDKADHPDKSDGLSEEQRWQAVLTRDGRYDGEFVFGDILRALTAVISPAARRPRNWAPPT